MASLANYKTAASANVSFAALKRKFIATTDSADKEAGPATPKGKGKEKVIEETSADAIDNSINDEKAKPSINPKKRGRKASAQVDDENVVADTTPARKKRAVKAKTVKPEERGSEALDHENNAVAKATPKKRGRKRKGADPPTPSVADGTEKFYSENDSVGEVDATTTVDDGLRIKQEEDVDGDTRTLAAQLTDHGAYEAQAIAGQALQLADHELYSDDRSI